MIRANPVPRTTFWRRYDCPLKELLEHLANHGWLSLTKISKFPQPNRETSRFNSWLSCVGTSLLHYRYIVLLFWIELSQNTEHASFICFCFQNISIHTKIPISFNLFMAKGIQTRHSRDSDWSFTKPTQSIWQSLPIFSNMQKYR